MTGMKVEFWAESLAVLLTANTVAAMHGMLFLTRFVSYFSQHNSWS
jgi:hypothetical protein